MTNGDLPEISPQELKEKLDKKEKIVVLDVREDFERDIAHWKKTKGGMA